VNDPHHPLQNRAIQNAFSPGSTLKVFLAYGALAQGLVDPQARVFCPGQATFYGRTFRCHKKEGHGWVDLRNAIKVSCDVYFYNLGRRLGIDRIAEIAKSFGLGSPTGVDLQFEKSGLVPSEEWALNKRRARWYPSETISVAIGQGPILVTPLQLARALSALVEGGRLPTPHLFLASQDPRTGARLRYRVETKPGIALSSDRAAIVRDGMWAVLNEPGGTAYLSRPPSVSAGGKTGTAQVVGRESGLTAKGKYEDHAWFIGFAPIDDPSDRRRGLRRERRPRLGCRGAARQGALRASFWKGGARRAGERSRANFDFAPRPPRRAASRRHPDDLPGPLLAQPDRPDRPRQRPRALRSRGPLRGLSHGRRKALGSRGPPGDVDRRRPGTALRGPPLRLSDAAQGRFSDLLREPRAARLPALLRRADRERQVVDPVRELPVPAGRAREGRDRAPARLSLRE
jgi:membrane peptidoglycan carboxypeptidase